MNADVKGQIIDAILHQGMKVFPLVVSPEQWEFAVNHLSKKEQKMENKPIVIEGAEAQAILEAKESLKPKVTLENAVADLKRQLSKESKNNLIRMFIGLYAQVINLSEQVERLKIENSKFKKSEAGASESTINTEASASEGESK